MPRFTIHDLAATIDARAASGGEASYTRKLLDKGAEHCAKKLGEEAVETVIAAVENDRDHLIAESADLLFHLLVLLKSRDVTLEAGEFERLRSLHDRLDMQEVEDIYLPLSRLLSIYVDAAARLFQAQRQFLGIRDRKVPYIIGIAGSVAVGKSTAARVLQALLARWSPRPKVDLVTTDGFLFPNAMLERQGMMQRKGFPESYDQPTLLSFLSDIKSGRRPVRAPVYSHLTYDIVPNKWLEVDRP